MSVAIDECRELDGDRVLVLDHRRARGRTSGVEIGGLETSGAGVWDARAAHVTTLLIYWERERALADLGQTA